MLLDCTKAHEENDLRFGPLDWIVMQEQLPQTAVALQFHNFSKLSYQVVTQVKPLELFQWLKARQIGNLVLA